MADGNSIPNHLTPAQLESLLELESGSIGAIAWLVMQEEAAGVKPEVICAGLGVGLTDLAALKEAVTGLSGSESDSVWEKAIVALKASAQLSQYAIGRGWDAIEAMAVDKLSHSLANMKTAGDPMQMLSIATQANKAIRRSKGEGSRFGNSTPSQHQDISIELNSGALGSIRLSLSPRIQQQLANPNPERVIDAVPKITAEAENSKPAKGSMGLEMLGLNETRQLADGKPLATDKPKTTVDRFAEMLSEMDFGITG